MTAKAISHFQADHILTRFVFPPLFEGQRKFDLIRWGILKEALTLFGENTAVNTSTNIAYPAYRNFKKGKHELFPIPEDELQINSKLEGVNNPGY